tara:strand:+ start:4495 stop:5271 length:777 start_codon:yes stop_codon:yes gene_type:complete
MDQKNIIRTVKELGNGGHIIAPKEWVNSLVEIKIINKPLNIEKDVLEILKPYLKSVIGIYLTGSYARKEQTSESDVDILVVTDKLNKKITQGKYEIILISEKEIKKSLKENIIPILPMLKEAKPIINPSLLNDLRKTKITKKNLRWHISHLKSAMEINKGLIDLNKAYLGDAIAYSLILNLRSIYIVNSLIKNEHWSNTALKQLIKKISNSLIAYDGYLRVKNNRKKGKELTITEASKLYKYIIKNIEEQEKWIKRKV